MDLPYKSIPRHAIFYCHYLEEEIDEEPDNPRICVLRKPLRPDKEDVVVCIDGPQLSSDIKLALGRAGGFRTREHYIGGSRCGKCPFKLYSDKRDNTRYVLFLNLFKA